MNRHVIDRAGGQKVDSDRISLNVDSSGDARALEGVVESIEVERKSSGVGPGGTDVLDVVQAEVGKVDGGRWLRIGARGSLRGRLGGRPRI